MATVSWYCSIPGFDVTQDCINQQDMANFGPAASPQTIQAAQAAWARTMAAAAREDPAGAAALYGMQHPIDATGNAISNATSSGIGVGLGILILGGLVVWMMSRR